MLKTGNVRLKFVNMYKLVILYIFTRKHNFKFYL